MNIPLAEKTKILYLKAVMTHSGKRFFEGLYRVIAIHENRVFAELAKVIVTSFDLDFEEVYRFYNIDKEDIETGLIVKGSAGADHNQGSADTEIGSVFNEQNRKASFIYGEKNEWRFSVELVKVIEGCDKIKLPAIVQSRGEVPPPLEDFIYHT